MSSTTTKMRRAQRKALREQNANKRFGRIMAIVWSIMAIILAANIVRFLTYESNYVSDPEYTVKEVISQRYGTIYNTVMNDVDGNIDSAEHSEFRELVAIMHYTQAAGQYRIYKENDMPDRAAYYKEKMDNAVPNLGKLDFTKDEIDEMLGIN